MIKTGELGAAVAGGKIPWMSASDLTAHLTFFFEKMGRLNYEDECYLLKKLWPIAQQDFQNTRAIQLMRDIKDREENKKFKKYLEGG